MQNPLTKQPPAIQEAEFNRDFSLEEIERARRELEARWYNLPVVLSYGLGYDSTALLLKFLLEPETRTFPLENLIVVTSMVGDEWDETAQNVQDVMIPLLRQHGVRFIQAARAGQREKDGIIILDDSRSPEKLYIDSGSYGAWTLTDHLLANAIVPMRMANARYCTMHFKGFVIDRVVHDILGDRSARRLIGYNADETGRIKDKSLGAVDQGYRYLIGFNADEESRVKEDVSATRGQLFEFPLIEWGMGREAVVEYVDRIAGRQWRKSSCVFCPFSCSSGGRPLLFHSYRMHPDAGGLAAIIEHNALAINPTQGLYSDAFTVPELLASDQNQAAIDDYERRLTEFGEWGVYLVRRIWKAPTPEAIAKAKSKGKKTTKQPRPDRQTKIIFRGTREAATTYVRALAAVYGTEAELIKGSWRFWSKPKQEERPFVEEMFVANFVAATEKTGISDYEGAWYRHTGEFPTHKNLDGDIIHETERTQPRSRVRVRN